MNVHAIAKLAVADHGACQKPAELAVVLGLLAADRPKLVVEIGTLSGGSIWAWSRVAHSKATIIGVDLDGRDHSGNVKAGQTYLPVRGDSTDPETVARVINLCRGCKPDFTFIDGDHADETVLSDLNHYRGHLTAVHDVLSPLAEFWAEESGPRALTVIADPGDDNHGYGPWGGIGVLL